MRKLITAFVVLFLLSAAVSADGLKVIERSQGAPSFLGYVPDRLIVVMKPDVGRLNIRVSASATAHIGEPEFDEISDRFAVSAMRQQFVGAEGELARYHKIKFEDGTLEDAMEAYRSHPMVETVEPIGIHTMYATPNDGFFDPYQWYHNQTSDDDIDSPEAWDIQTGSTSIIVAILDSGTRYYHRDLGGANGSPSNPGAARGNMWINNAELNGSSGVDDDGNGYTDDWIGYDFISSTSNCWPGEDCGTQDNDPRDFNGHGTHTSGIVGMITNNGYGMAGVAGGWGTGSETEYGNGVKVMACRMGFSYNYLGQEYGVVYMDAAAEAFYYAADNGANIASCSWGSSNSGGIGAAATYFINNGGMIFVAAGNDGTQTADYLNGRGDCVSVSATTSTDGAASFTTYGTWVDICAPGVGIYSTYHDHADPATDYWASMDGTSMACPMAAATAAMIWSQNPGWTASQVETQLYASAENIDAELASAYIGKMGAGRINLYDAVNTGPPPAPVAAFVGSPTSGTEPLTVSFTDQSTGSITSWDWTFGDGGTSTAQDPSYEYSSAGTYTVTLTVTGPGGSDGETKTNYITVNPCTTPTASFTGSPTSGDYPLNVSFTNTSTGATSYLWDFGDTQTSTAANPNHTYTSAGTFTVTLTATNSCGNDQMVRTDYITVTEPTGGFCDDFQDGDISDWTILSGDWTVSGGQLDGYIASNRAFIMSPLGDISDATVTVDWTSLTGGTWTNGIVVFGFVDASNYRVADCRDGANNWYIREFIGGTQYNRANFAETINTNQQYALEVIIDPSGLVTVKADGATKVSYNFGNVQTGQVGLEVNQSHSQFDNFCVDAEPPPPPPPTAAFSGTPTSGDYPLLVTFTDESTDNPTSWNWDFGDGTGTSTAQNPQYTYNSAGVYTVTLTATNAYGSDDEIKTDYITVNEPSVATVVGEVGEEVRSQTGAGADWYTVNLNNSYTNPVVVMHTLSFNGSHPTHLRVRNVGTTSFEWQQEEWDYKDGNHTTENCPYIVVEAGMHTLEDGTVVEAGIVSASTSWVTVNFSRAFGSSPTLLAGVASDNDAAACVARTRNLGTGSFQIRVQEEEGADGVHASETVTWVAISQGSGSNNGVDFLAGRTSNSVTDSWYTISYSPSFGSTPIFLCHGDTFDGGDPCGTRYRNNTGTSVEVFMEEEASGDTEIAHTTEIVSYLAWGVAGDIVTQSKVAQMDSDLSGGALADSQGQIPDRFDLSQNYPNPFNPATTIEFSLPTAAHVTLTVYNVMGQEVDILTRGNYDAGKHSVEWDASRYASGLYLYRLDAGSYIDTKKMILLK